MVVRVGVLIWGLASHSWSTAAAADPIIDKIEKERKALDQLKDQIEETRKQADAAGKRRESLLQGIQTLDERLLRYRQTHQEISRQLHKKDQEIEVINTRLAGLRASTRERQDAILARLKVQYMAIFSAGFSISLPSPNGITPSWAHSEPI
jgi:murein hydrolase activator